LRAWNDHSNFYCPVNIVNSCFLCPAKLWNSNWIDSKRKNSTIQGDCCVYKFVVAKDWAMKEGKLKTTKNEFLIMKA